MDLGKYNKLRAQRYTSVGLYLEDEHGERVLLPRKWTPENLPEGEEIEVFVYLDNEERHIATTMAPKAQVGDFAYLKVKEVSSHGAFLDWGIEKDLFVPFREQYQRMESGESYVVYVYVDEKTYRIAASTKLEKFLEKAPGALEAGQEVDLIIADPTPLGYKVVINNQYSGLIYSNEIFRKIETGDQCRGYIQEVRDDGKVDVGLEKPGYAKIEPHAQRVLEELKNNQGFLTLNDKSAPEEIYSRLEMSKKSFKKAIGGLYRNKQIKMEEDGIRLLKP